MTYLDPTVALMPIDDERARRASTGEIRFLHAEQEHQHNQRLEVMRAALPLASKSKTRPTMVRYLQAMAQSTPVPPAERVELERVADSIKQPFDRNRAWFSWQFLGRAMGVTPGSKGGYLVDTEQLEPVDVLRGASVVASAGIETPDGFTGSITVPVVKTAPTASHVAEGATASTSDPVFGQASAAPKLIVAIVPVSHQLLKQSDERAERFIVSLVMRAVAQAFDRAILAGAGGVEPLGLFNMPGIGTQAGSSLDHADLLAMQRQVVAAGADERDLVWLGAPTVAEALQARQRFTDSDRTCWDDGQILGKRAVATANVPTGSLVVGAFSNLLAPIFGPGIRIDIDPSTLWNSGGIQIRALLFCDVIATQPAAFSVAKDIT